MDIIHMVINDMPSDHFRTGLKWLFKLAVACDFGVPFSARLKTFFMISQSGFNRDRLFSVWAMG